MGKAKTKAKPACLQPPQVIFCWFSGFIHVYYCFGLSHWWTSLTLLYRLGFLAEFTMEEVLPSNADSETWRLAVDFVMIVMSLSMSIILMNVLIGVLAESYNRGLAPRGIPYSISTYQHLFMVF